MTILCKKCKRKTEFAGVALRGVYGQNEAAQYWCVKCKILYLEKIKDYVSSDDEVE